MNLYEILIELKKRLEFFLNVLKKINNFFNQLKFKSYKELLSELKKLIQNVESLIKKFSNLPVQNTNENFYDSTFKMIFFRKESLKKSDFYQKNYWNKIESDLRSSGVPSDVVDKAFAYSYIYFFLFPEIGWVFIYRVEVVPDDSVQYELLY